MMGKKINDKDMAQRFLKGNIPLSSLPQRNN
jgi:hypothetical protein